MKCMTCSECSDKKYCATLNGLPEVPYPLVAYKIKGCHDSHLEELRNIICNEYSVPKELLFPEK